MVVLKNIKRENNLIHADFFPEGDTKGYLVLDIEQKRIIDYTPAEGYGDCRAALFYAQRRILRMVENHSLKEEAIEYWY